MMARTTGTGARSSGYQTRWPVFFIGLALVELFVVGFSIYLYRGATREYAASVEQGTVWASRVARYGRLQTLGNEILSSTRERLRPSAGLEGGRLEAGVGQFGKQLDRAREELDAAPATSQTEELQAELDSAASLMTRFGADAWVVASYVKDGLSAQADRASHGLNRTAASARAVLQRLVSSARSEQKEILLEQSRMATAAQAAAWPLIAAAVALCGLIFFHGVHLVRQARMAAAAAEAGARSKSAFLSRMGYAIRTPMNSIIGLTEVVLDSSLTTEQRSSLTTVRSAAEDLLWTLTNVLDYAKAQAGRLTLDNGSVDIRACIHDVVRTMARRARAKGLELVWSVDPEVPHAVKGDAKRLQQVIGNLVENAITFTDYGEVVVRARAESHSDEDWHVTFDVSDTGAGIPEDKRRELFAAFHEDAREAGSSEGLGVGLATAVELVSLMEGKMGVESEVGRGTTFRFSARFEIDPETDPRELTDGIAELRERRVLVVDDNATSRQILCGMLRSARAVPTAAENADEAIAMMRTANEAGHPYALALVDIEMPGVTGLELAQRIKAEAAFGATNLVALGATGEAEEAEQCRQVGMAGYLAKPIRGSELLELLRNVLATSAGQRKDSKETPGHRKLRVLLVDDNRVDRRLGVRLLQKRGHDVVAAEDGKEAVEISAREPFDLILMDVEMPQMDGLQATARIRERERETGSTRVPIIALTAHDMKGRCAEVGMDDYVTKPVDAYEVNEVMTRHVSMREVEMDDSQTTTVGPRPMDQEAALERAGGEHSLLVELANMCLADTPDALESIRTAVEGGDAKGVQRAAHKLKGSLLVLAADPASEAAYRLETIGAEGTLDNAAAALSTLEVELDRLRPALTRLAESESLEGD